MACRCAERAAQLRQARSQLASGQVRGAVRELGAAARTLAQDARSGDLRRAATTRLAQIRAGRK